MRTPRTEGRRLAAAAALAGLLAAAPSFGLDTGELRERLDAAARLREDGRYQAAEDQARGLLRDAETSFGEGSLATAEVLDELLAALYWNGKRLDPQTVELAETAVRLREALNGPASPEAARSLHRLGLLASSNGDGARAAEALDRALTIRVALFGPVHAEVAETLSELAYLRFVGEMDQVVWSPVREVPPDCREGLPARQAAGLRLAREAVVLGEETLDAGDARLAELFNGLAHLQGRAGCFTHALVSHRRCLELRRATLRGDHPQVGRSLYNVGVAEYRLGNLAEATRLAEEALQIRRDALGDDHPHVASTHSGLAYLLHLSGDLAAAEAHYRAAVEGLARGYGEMHFRHATALHNLAAFLEELGDLDQARELYQRAAEIRERSDNERLGETLTSLGLLLLDLGDPESAGPILERATKEQLERLGPGHPDLARTLAARGRLSWERGDAEAAESRYREALALTETVGPEHPELIQALEGLAEVEEWRGDWKASLEHLDRASGILAAAYPRDRLGFDPPRKGELIYRRARTLAHAGRRAEALRQALVAHRILFEHVAETARWLPERQALAYSGSLAGSRDLLLHLAAMRPTSRSQPGVEEVWEAVARSRALVFDEMLARHRQLRSTDPAAEPLIRHLGQARQALARARVQLESDLVDRQDALRVLDSRRKDAEAAEAAWARYSAAVSGLPDPQPGESDRVLYQALDHLPHGGALVALARYHALARPAAGAGWSPPPPHYLAFAREARSRQLRLRPLGPADRIDEAADRLRGAAAAALADPTATELDYRRAGRDLLRWVWKPLASDVAGAQAVFLVPDGSLHLVSLDTLPQRGGRYLIETAPPIHLLTAERDLLRFAEPASPHGGLLALGGADFYDRTALHSPPPDGGRTGAAPMLLAQATLRSACPGDRLFDPLPGSRLEVERIARLWRDRPAAPGAGPAEELTGPRASEGNFKKAASAYGMLHLATHGFFAGEACGTGPSARGAPGTLTGGEPGLEDDGATLSGLVLAGANFRGTASAEDEDGILTAGEIAGLDLSGVGWAVLSGCDTGVGNIRPGEGVFGLRRAFQVAGARTLIMSLWTVEDRIALEWMTALYAGRFESGLSTLDAVRQASLERLAERRRAGASTHPGFWGAFVASGDWR